MPSKKILVLGDIEDGLTYHEFRKRYKELIDGLNQKDISEGYRRYKAKQDDKPIVIPVSTIDIESVKSTYKKYKETSTKIGINKINDFVWCYYIRDNKGNITTKDFSSEESNRIETCYRNVLEKGGGGVCKHMKIDFITMRWRRSNTQNIDVIRKRRNENNISTIIEEIKVPSYREIKENIKIRNKKSSIPRFTPKKKKLLFIIKDEKSHLSQ